MLVERTLCQYIQHIHFFNSNVPLPTLGGSSKVRQKKQQTQGKKRKQLQNVVSPGKRKGRRSDQTKLT